MKEINISDGWYAAHWSLTDFYDKSEKALRDALNSGEDFATEEFGCKKEIHYARVIREGDTVTVTVSAHMDDLEISEDSPLVLDAMSYVGMSEDELSEDEIEQLAIYAIECGVEDRTELWESFPAEDANYNHVVNTIERLEEDAEKTNESMFGQLCVLVRNYAANRNRMEG